jgi:hypothetical protein
MRTNLIKDWKILLLNGNDVIIYGYIYNDIKKRFEDGTYIHTSKVLKADFVNGVVETRNSVYHLEKKE